MKNQALTTLFLCLPIYLLLTITVHATTVFGPQDFSTGWWKNHFSVHTFTADSSVDGQITISKTTPNKKYKRGFVFINGKFIRLKRFLKGNDLVFEKNIHLRQNNFLVIFFRGKRGASLSIEINQKSSVPPPEVTFSPNPPSIVSGETSTLTWSTENADTVSLEPGIGVVQQSGSLGVSPSETTQYTITATGSGGTISASATVTVTIPEPTVTINASPSTLELGNSSTLSWNSTNADNCSIEPGIGSIDCNSSTSISPTATTNYTITATGPGGTSSAQVVVTVMYPEPIAALSAAPSAITSGESSTLTWSTQYAQTCTIEPNIGIVPCAGELTVTPAEETTYILTAGGQGGTTTAQVNVTVMTTDDILSLTITSPSDGDSISRPDVMVTGTIHHRDGLETGVMVNGVTALVYDGQFVANHVPLIDGENTITVKAVDVNGEHVEKTVAVTAETSKRYVELSADAKSGLAPLETTLRLSATFPSEGTPVFSGIGPGDVVYTDTDTPGNINVSMNQSGIYVFYAELSDSNGNIYRDKVAVLLMDRQQLDDLLQAKWEGMKAALTLNQIDSALPFFMEGSRTIYGHQFEFMATEGVLLQVINKMGTFRLVEHDGYGVIYDLRTLKDDIEYSFQVLFVQDTEGIWRIKNY